MYTSIYNRPRQLVILWYIQWSWSKCYYL